MNKKLNINNTHMIPFRNITTSDRDIILEYTLNSNRRNCDLSFSNLCSWGLYYHTQYAIWNNFLIFRFWTNKKMAYMMPVGKGDLRQTIIDMINDSKQENHPFCMLGVCIDMKNELEDIYQNDFDFIHDRDYDDYIYLRTDLATLKGNKYQSKRNFINRFKKMYDYEYLDITSANVEECIALEMEWFANNKESNNESTKHERNALTFAMRHFNEIGLKGGLIRVNNKTIAFSFGMPINKDTFGVHVEKADTNYVGAYTMINYEFANRIPQQYTYINREEDLGVEGLRKAKLSYHPAILLEKHMASLKEESIKKMIDW